MGINIVIRLMVLNYNNVNWRLWYKMIMILIDFSVIVIVRKYWLGWGIN